MTANYHNRIHRVPAVGDRALRVAAAIGLVAGLSGCSFSMPMESFVDERPTGAIAKPVVKDAAVKHASHKVDVAVAQPPTP